MHESSMSISRLKAMFATDIVREYPGEILLTSAKLTAFSRDWMGPLASCLKSKLSVPIGVAESPWLRVPAWPRAEDTESTNGGEIIRK
jgi:hypothetical protein